MKKFMLLAGSLLMLCLMTGYATADTSGVTGGLYWVANDSISAVVGCNPGLTNVTVPSKLGGKPVQLIAAQDFLDCTTLKSITFPEGLLAIGQGAFEDCTSLETVSFPDTLVLLGDYAFHRCKSLSGVHLPANTQYIGAWCFSSCSNLTDVNFPKSLQFIGENGFSGCGLTRIWLPDSLETIDKKQGTVLCNDRKAKNDL